MKTSQNVRFAFVVAALASLSISGCSSETDEGDLIEEASLASSLSDEDNKADRPSISFTTFTDDIGSNGTTETRRVFTTASSYRNYFGHAAPRSVNFAAGDWVVFYSAGRRNTGGYTASISSIRRTDSGLTLKVTTSLESPGADCFVTQALTKPYVLARFRAPKVPAIEYVRYYRDDTTKSCQPEACLSLALCVDGYHFDETPGVCACVPDQQACLSTALCVQGFHFDSSPAVCACVPDAPTGPFCGGIAAIQCVGGSSCVDNPNDSCDPNLGGADCGGVCQCNALGFCIEGWTWSSDPAICGCVRR